jgi:predicted ArsR family transcriptional regulator
MVVALVGLAFDRAVRDFRERHPLAKRVSALAAIRREEGYLAEWSRGTNDSLRLIENHCPICVAAASCSGLCAGELDLFRKILGPDAEVEREEHMLDDSRRCLYVIRPR